MHSEAGTCPLWSGCNLPFGGRALSMWIGLSQVWIQLILPKERPIGGPHPFGRSHLFKGEHLSGALSGVFTRGM